MMPVPAREQAQGVAAVTLRPDKGGEGHLDEAGKRKRVLPGPVLHLVPTGPPGSDKPSLRPAPSSLPHCCKNGDEGKFLTPHKLLCLPLCLPALRARACLLAWPGRGHDAGILS